MDVGLCRYVVGKCSCVCLDFKVAGRRSVICGGLG